MKYEKIKGAQNHNLFRPFDKDGVLRDVIWVRFYRAGKGRLEESLKTSLIGEARILRDKRIAEFLGERPKFAGRGVLVEDKFPEFLELKMAKSEGTFEVNETCWRLRLKDAFGGMLLDDVHESSWMMYVIEDRKKNPGRKYFNDRKTLQNFLNWLHTAGEIQRKPLLENVDPERDAGKVYQPEEIRALLDHAKDPLKLQIQMACEMAMRHGEIWSLEWSQVNFKNKLIHLPAHKTKIRKARTFAMSDGVYTALFELQKEKISLWVFPSEKDSASPAGRSSSNNQWVKAKRSSGVTGRFHDLRHTALTNMFKNAINPALICEFAGLSLSEAQNTYLHFTPEDTRPVASLFKIRDGDK